MCGRVKILAVLSWTTALGKKKRVLVLARLVAFNSLSTISQSLHLCEGVYLCVCEHRFVGTYIRIGTHKSGSGISRSSTLLKPVEQRSFLRCYCSFEWILTLTKDPKETWLERVKSDPSRQCGGWSEEHIYCDLSKGSFELAKCACWHDDNMWIIMCHTYAVGIVISTIWFLEICAPGWLKKSLIWVMEGVLV